MFGCLTIPERDGVVPAVRAGLTTGRGNFLYILTSNRVMGRCAFLRPEAWDDGKRCLFLHTSGNRCGVHEVGACTGAWRMCICWDKETEYAAGLHRWRAASLAIPLGL